MTNLLNLSIKSDDNIILVGNGPIVCNYDIGDKIDQFDKVVRFNNFETKNYEKHVGTKIDLWSMRVCFTIKYKKLESKPIVVGFINYCKYTPQIISEHLQPWKGRFVEYNPQVIGPEFAQSYSRIFKYDPQNTWFSVGMLTIFMLLGLGVQKLTIHGFGGDPSKHYFDLPPQNYTGHNFRIERKIIEYLHRKGKLEYLV